jgi:uncharacterized protein (TIGR00369 family)
MHERPSAPSPTAATDDDALARLRADLDRVAAPWVRDLGLELIAADAQSATFRLPVSPTLVHGGGVLCGQALMAAADTAMVIAVASSLGGFQPMTTVQLATSFLSAVPAAAEAVTVTATVLRRGRKLVFGEIELRLADGTLAAHATTAYTLL